MRRRRHAAGFTLIEVLVALIIVALGMGALLTALTSAADNVQRLREKSFAEWVGLNQLEAARLSRVGPVLGRSDGEVDFAGGRWRWVQRVANMEIPGIVRIDIQVRRLAGVAREDAGKDAAASSAAGLASAAAAGRGGAPSDDDDTGADWLATVTGFRGNAIASPAGTASEWDTLATQGGGSTGAPASPPVAPGGAR